MPSVNYIVYDDKGKIVKQVYCLPIDIQANSKGFHFIEGTGDSKKHKVVDNKLVEKTELEIFSEKLEKENKRALKREQGLTKLRTSVSYELSVVDPNVISLLKKLQIIPQDL